MNAPRRLSSLVRPALALVAACGGLLLIPAIATLGAAGPPRFERAAVRPVADRTCGGAACDELVEVVVKDVVPLESASHAVVLVTRDREIVLPIFVDEAAALAIALRLAHRPAPHPQAQDLMDSMMTELGGELTEVRIDRVDDSVFTGRVLISQGTKRLQLDARPSDSIALALAHGVKIFATRKVLARAGISQAEIDRLQRHGGEARPGTGGSGPDEGASGGDDDSPGEALPPEHQDPIRL